jgi:hypothetical protein
VSVDLSTKSGVLAFAKRERERMSAEFDKSGRFERRGFAFDAWVFATHAIDHDPSRTGVDAFVRAGRLPAVTACRCSPPALLAVVDDPGMQKDGYAHVIAEYAKMTRAIGTLFMSEIWVGQANLPKEAKREDFEAWRDARPASIEDWDDRREALYMALEHTATGRLFWSAPITRKPTRLGAWEELKFDDAEGRFVGLVEVRS